MASTIDGPAIAARFHEWYEHYAPAFGYETRAESAVPWEKVPEANRRLMAATVVAVLTEPHTVLCWEQDRPGLGTACDRAAWHTGPHSWESLLLLQRIATARRGDCGGQEWEELEELPDEIRAMWREYEAIARSDAGANALQSVEWGEVTCVDHGIQVTQADPYARMALELLAGSDGRGIRVSGSYLTFGSFGQSVSYRIIGWQANPPALLMEKC